MRTKNKEINIMVLNGPFNGWPDVRTPLHDCFVIYAREF